LTAYIEDDCPEDIKRTSIDIYGAAVKMEPLSASLSLLFRFFVFVKGLNLSVREMEPMEERTVFFLPLRGASGHAA
jgi:hypothetical protein